MLESRISVVIPTRNRKEEVERAIQSVLAQREVNPRIIVVDDGSTDGTSAYIAQKFPDVTLITNTVSKGGAYARNQGARVTDTDYVAFLDSDDEWLPNHIRNAMSNLQQDLVDGVFGSFFLEQDDIRRQVVFATPPAYNGQVGDLIFSFQRFDARTSTFVFKKRAFDAIRFDDNLKKHQDWDLAIRFDKSFTWAVSDEPTVIIHVPDSGRMSSSLNHEATHYFLRKHANAVKPDNLFAFCLKQIMRSQLSGETRDRITQYLKIVSPMFGKLSFRNRVVYCLLKARILNIGLFYKIKRKLFQVHK